MLLLSYAFDWDPNGFGLQVASLVSLKEVLVWWATRTLMPSTPLYHKAETHLCRLLSLCPAVSPASSTKTTENNSALTSKCMLNHHNIRKFVQIWPWPLTFDLENLFSNAHSHDEYLCQVSLKSLQYVEISNRVKQVLTTDSRMDYQKTSCLRSLLLTVEAKCKS